MSQHTPEELAALADEMSQEARNIANAWIEMGEMDTGRLCATDVERELLAVGIEAGYIATLQMLQKRGLLPGLA